MSRSWGHCVWPIPERDRKLYAGRDWWTCRAKGCPNEPTHYTNYSYVTGRAGRVSNATRRACAQHAERFVQKHDARRLDASPGTQSEANERVFASILRGRP